ncbi:hypothetical protein HXX76_000761 [Chlamydomonas incerta]|uniref:Fe2OG dioxygenase domain-containing protein n=1 Tax=Chlamydomonas incerta TaxID=51695 RepID=A0A836B2Y2_CHLIN|nr:hypothetical protein HXX76_000761 [Chlamydomonas incerta]|eukprot:KAG2446166.1 hypothetical protein HXX76_000761 [Chlamydomonas incerta]
MAELVWRRVGLKRAALVFTAAFLLRLSLAAAAGVEEERLIGWRGDTYKPKNTLESQEPFVSVISWEPRAFVIRNFLTDQEATHIADVAQVHMRRSTVVADNGSSVLDDYRTSYGTFINRYATPVLAKIEDRVAVLTRVPVQYQEDMQVLRYGNGQYYHRHTDSLENDSPRLATVLLYLSDPELGGETAFPLANTWTHPDMPKVFGPFSDCVKGNVAFKPRKGDALLFWSVKPDGKTEDPLSEHEGCPVIRGVKWTATVWVHTKPFRPEEWDDVAKTFTRNDVEEDPGECTDRHKECPKWKAAGECEKNFGYMQGDANQVGSCRLSCGVCEDCEPGDRDCYSRNREKQGYLVYHPEELITPRSGESGATVGEGLESAFGVGADGGVGY